MTSRRTPGSSHWDDIVTMMNEKKVRMALRLAVAKMSRPIDAVELVSYRFVVECSPVGLNRVIPATYLKGWRDRIVQRAFIRWESRMRERLIYDAITQAAADLEQRAKKAGVRLGRPGLSVLRDSLLRKYWEE